MNHRLDLIAHLNDARGALNRAQDIAKRYWPEGQEIMADDFRHWGLKDVALLSNLMAVELAWMRDCRHSQTEDIANERARCAELSQAMRAFNNERLARNGGAYWVPVATDFKLVDRLTEVDGAFVEGVLKEAIPAWGKGVSRLAMDSKYWLLTQRDAWRVIEWSQVNTIPWEAELYDCDDHAEALRNDFRTFGINCCGMVIDWSGGHAYNVIFFPDGQFWFLEPQSDKIVSIGRGIYELKQGVILL